MIKRFLIGGGFVVVILAIAIYFAFNKGETVGEVLISEVVSPNAVLFLENGDYSYFAGNGEQAEAVWQDIIAITSSQEVDSGLFKISSFLKEADFLVPYLNKGGINLSINQIGMSRLLPVFYITVGSEMNENSIVKGLQAEFQNDLNLLERKYESETLYEISGNASSERSTLSMCLVNGILVLSPSAMLVEESIRTIHSAAGIYYHSGFQEVQKVAGKNAIGNLYVNYNELEKLFLPLIDKEYYKRYAFLGHLADWGEFDLDIKDNSIIFNGISSLADSSSAWLNLLKGQAPVKIEAARMVPANATDYLSIGISNTVLFKERLEHEMYSFNKYYSYSSEDREYVKLLGESPFSKLLEMLHNEIVLFHVQESMAEEYSKVALWKVRSRSETLDLINGWTTVLAEAQQVPVSSYIHNYQLDEQSVFKIYQLPIDLYPESIPGWIIDKYYTMYDNILIMSDSYEAIKNTIYLNVLKKTMIHEQGFKSINNLISTRVNICYVLLAHRFLNRLTGTTDIVQNLLKSAEKSELLKKFKGVVIQYTQDESITFSNISMSHSQVAKSRAHTVWESLLDTSAISKPYLLINHNTMEKEIMVQDAGNKLYLLNSMGRVLWKLQLDGRILSEVYQVDYYRNNKLQYLFNTSERLYLIDRNGNRVEKYPVTLRSKATNGMALFDYDRNKNYRIFIAGKDKKIYLYNLEGNLVTGWNSGKTEGIVRNSLQHFRIEDKDYIVFADEIRPYILNRRGEERVSISSGLAVSPNNGFYLDMNINGSSPRFITTDTTGSVFAIEVNGEVVKLYDNEIGTDHYFQYSDLNSDGMADYIFAYENFLEVVENDGESLFSYKIKNDIRSKPDIYEFSSSDFKLGLTEESGNLIYLVNSDGGLYDGFPLEGSTRFSIGYFTGSESRFNLIVGSKNGFLYNYSIK